MTVPAPAECSTGRTAWADTPSDIKCSKCVKQKHLDAKGSTSSSMKVPTTALVELLTSLHSCCMLSCSQLHDPALQRALTCLVPAVCSLILLTHPGVEEPAAGRCVRQE